MSDIEIVYYDEYGQPYSVDIFGRKTVPLSSEILKENSGFAEYDTSAGHCGFCGKLTCNGQCFK